MSGQSTYSLSEAVTALAFSDPTEAPAVPLAINDNRWGCSPTDALSALTKAAHDLCDAGYRGAIEILGRDTVFSLDAKPDRGPLRPLTRSECDAHKLFQPGYDTLWDGKNCGDVEEDVFAAQTKSKGLDDVRIDRSGLLRLMASPAPFDVPEIDAWIESAPYTGMKVARRAFMKEPRAKGLSATFEIRWKVVKPKPVGRPRSR